MVLFFFVQLFIKYLYLNPWTSSAVLDDAEHYRGVTHVAFGSWQTFFALHAYNLVIISSPFHFWTSVARSASIGMLYFPRWLFSVVLIRRSRPTAAATVYYYILVRITRCRTISFRSIFSLVVSIPFCISIRSRATYLTQYERFKPTLSQ